MYTWRSPVKSYGRRDFLSGVGYRNQNIDLIFKSIVGGEQ
jgi:hypothetical protein